MAYTPVRFITAIGLAVIITIGLFILMKFLVGGFDRMTTAATEKLFNLNTVVVDDTEEERPERVRRPGTLPEPPLLSEGDIPDSSEDVTEQANRTADTEEASANNSTLDEILQKKREIISTLEE